MSLYTESVITYGYRWPWDKNDSGVYDMRIEVSFTINYLV